MSGPNYQEIADCADTILLTLLQANSISGDPERRRAKRRNRNQSWTCGLHAECADRDTVWVLVAALARMPSHGNVLSLLLRLIDTGRFEAFWEVDYDGGGQLLRLEPFRRVEHLKPGQRDGERGSS